MVYDNRKLRPPGDRLPFFKARLALSKRLIDVGGELFTIWLQSDAALSNCGRGKGFENIEQLVTRFSKEEPTNREMLREINELMAACDYLANYKDAGD